METNAKTTYTVIMDDWEALTFVAALQSALDHNAISLSARDKVKSMMEQLNTMVYPEEG